MDALAPGFPTARTSFFCLNTLSVVVVLENIGVITTIAQDRGESSYPTEYTLTYGNAPNQGQAMSAGGSTLELALLAFVEKLLQARGGNGGEQDQAAWRDKPA